MRVDSSIGRIALAVAGVLLGLGAAWAAAPGWKALTAAQQALIAPALQSQGGNFDALPEARRENLVRGANRWLAMTPEQRTATTRQFQQWQQLSVAQKVEVLERRERFRKLAPEQRKALIDTQKQFLELPMQQQAELRNEFSELQPAFEGLPSQPFSPTATGAPGATSPLGLPATGLPSTNNTGGVTLPNTTR